MNYLAIIINVFLLCCLELHCVSGSQDCSPFLIDRYCALKDGDSIVKCARRSNISRSFEVYENCYDSLNSDGKHLTLDEKIERVCKLDHEVYNAVKECYQTAAYIDLKQTKTVYKVSEICISRAEIKEGKYCGIGKIFHHYHHLYPTLYK
ncbi:uncharacterized protein [Centruroides vittatus]|uniref:uncharacterized protein n=1 Tax=Centruroides vittatus TaxID=120091 RepID=UPI00350FD7CF